MTLNQDIDALLVSALYGELTPADEARLATHLESHPADRSALDDLKVARQTIRESRIFELQLDPPQAISALLLQEAARRAPKRVVVDDTKRETWFGRFVRSFVAHPAMAAAATLVLVVGVAGTIYMRKGNDQFAEQVADQSVAKGEGGGAPAREVTSPTTGVVAGPAMGSAASATNEDGVTVALRDEENDKAQGHGGDGKKSGEKSGAGDAYRKADTTSTVTTERDRGKQAAHTNVSKPPVSKGIAYVEPRPDLTPKDLDVRGSKVASPDPETRLDGIVAGGVATNTPTAPGASPSGAGTSSPRNAAPTPPPAQIANSDRPQTVTKPTDDAKKESSKDKDDAATVWARDTHQRLLGFVKSGKCQDAAPLAVQIKNKAPDYYNAYVANDRGLKQCMAYINDATERDAEKSQKSRPAKRNEALDSAK